jgi:AbrB family looped-hinge helix DNA binding protein
MEKQYCHGDFYGTTKLGEKGQVVVPAEARTALKIEKGEKLLVFGMGHDMLVFAKFSELEKFTEMLSERLVSMKNIMKVTKGKYKSAKH